MTYSRSDREARELQVEESSMLKLLLLSRRVTVVPGISDGTEVSDLVWQSTDEPLHVQSVGHGEIDVAPSKTTITTSCSWANTMIASFYLAHWYLDIMPVRNFLNF